MSGRSRVSGEPGIQCHEPFWLFLQARGLLSEDWEGDRTCAKLDGFSGSPCLLRGPLDKREECAPVQTCGGSSKGPLHVVSIREATQRMTFTIKWDKLSMVIWGPGKLINPHVAAAYIFSCMGSQRFSMAWPSPPRGPCLMRPCRRHGSAFHAPQKHTHLFLKPLPA